MFLFFSVIFNLINFNVTYILNFYKMGRVLEYSRMTVSYGYSIIGISYLNN